MKVPKNNTHNPQPTVSEAPQSATATETPIRTANNLFALARGAEGRTAADKVRFMGDIRQRLAQVADEVKKNGEDAAEVENLAAKSATRLYDARKSGMISGDELTGVLGDVFGYKPKADGTPGKTPAGAGEAMRKRIVRSLQGWDFINGGDGGRFFETMDKDDVAPIINSIGDDVSVWTAYKLLGDLKSQGTVRVEFAFDPKKIAGLTDKLSEAGARDQLINNPSLVKAYAALFDQLQILSTVDESEVEAISAKLGGDVATEDGEQMAA